MESPCSSQGLKSILFVLGSSTIFRMLINIEIEGILKCYPARKKIRLKKTFICSIRIIRYNFWQYLTQISCCHRFLQSHLLPYSGECHFTVPINKNKLCAFTWEKTTIYLEIMFQGFTEDPSYFSQVLIHGLKDLNYLCESVLNTVQMISHHVRRMRKPMERIPFTCSQPWK